MNNSLQIVNGFLALLSTAALLSTSLVAEELSAEACAARLQKATVTIRIRLHPQTAKEGEESDSEEAAQTNDAAAHVTVCSGVAVGERLIVTAAFAAADSQIRITLPGGDQTDARLRVLDEFSGLALLETNDSASKKDAAIRFASLPFAEQAPTAGSWIMAAAAWGAEQPLVSVGVVGGLDRAIKGFVYPPLLQCDVRPAETSCGAGIIDRQGRLVGVVVAGDRPETNQGWLYAVPVSHVQRLLRARIEKSREDSVVVLKRRRPTLGVTLEPTEAGVFVNRVVSASPADKAGIKKGDRIVAAEGTNIRSVYEAVRPTLYKQPGDTMTFLVERDGEEHTIELVLGGGVELPSASLSVLGQLVAPKIDIGLSSRRSRAGVVEPDVTISEVYSVPAAGSARQVSEAADKAGAASANKLRLLEKANERYRLVIEHQQRELARREEERQQQTELIEALKSELNEAKQQTAPK